MLRFDFEAGGAGRYNDFLRVIILYAYSQVLSPDSLFFILDSRFLSIQSCFLIPSNEGSFGADANILATPIFLRISCQLTHLLSL